MEAGPSSLTDALAQKLLLALWPIPLPAGQCRALEARLPPARFPQTRGHRALQAVQPAGLPQKSSHGSFF